jgi:hemerythrin-like domain-containing protein
MANSKERSVARRGAKGIPRRNVRRGKTLIRGARVVGSAPAPKATRTRSPGLEQRGREGSAPEIMASLNSEHRHIASLLDALAEQSDNLLPGRVPDYALMRDIARYMASFPDEYHHPREDLLFARLRARDPGAESAVLALEEGHEEIYRRSRELRAALDAVVENGSAADARKLKFLCDRYIGFYWDHINTEEGKVFPLAMAKLRRDDWLAVNSESRQVDDPLFGARVRKEYRRLSRHLVARVERVTEDIAAAELFGVEALVESVVAIGSAAGEIRDILGRRLRLSVGGALDVSARTLARRELGAAMGLPALAAAGVLAQAREGFAEIASVAKRARAEVGEPFVTRMRHFRKLAG